MLPIKFIFIFNSFVIRKYCYKCFLLKNIILFEYLSSVVIYFIYTILHTMTDLMPGNVLQISLVHTKRFFNSLHTYVYIQIKYIYTVLLRRLTLQIKNRM